MKIFAFSLLLLSSLSGSAFAGSKTCTYRNHANTSADTQPFQAPEPGTSPHDLRDGNTLSVEDVESESGTQTLYTIKDYRGVLVASTRSAPDSPIQLTANAPDFSIIELECK